MELVSDIIYSIFTQPPNPIFQNLILFTGIIVYKNVLTTMKERQNLRFSSEEQDFFFSNITEKFLRTRVDCLRSSRVKIV